jgi:two-component system CheB/CheR fusion protein
MNNLLMVTQIGVLFLDRGFRIKHFTPAAGKVFNLISSDLHRPIFHVSHRMKGIDLEAFLRKVNQEGEFYETEVLVDGAVYLLRASPYRTEEKLVDGVVITLVDVTRIRSAEKALAFRESQVLTVLSAIPDSVMIVTVGLLRSGNTSTGVRESVNAP